MYLPQVDAEHRELFRMAEEIHQAARAGAEAARVSELVGPSATAIEEHFAHEERMMQSAAVPDLRLAQTAARYGAEAERAVRSRTSSRAMPRRRWRLLEFLARWFKDHMSLTDRMMGAHVRNYERLPREARFVAT